jgi:hypothetical protein
MSLSTNTKRFQVTYGQLAYWSVFIWPKHKEKGLRYGQSWFSHFYEFQSPEFKETPFPELFYETNIEKAKQLIEDNTQYIEDQQ